MASGFLVKPDGDFQFFFSYGALDRQGSGRWTTENGRIIFNSTAKPLADFALVESNQTANDFINIRMQDGNAGILRHIFCSLENGAAGTWEQMSQQGDVQFPPQTIKSISLQFEFVPERFSTIPVPDPLHNEFLFRFEPTIVEVFLETFSLKHDSNELSGGHPLLAGHSFRYVKQ